MCGNSDADLHNDGKRGNKGTNYHFHFIDCPQCGTFIISDKAKDTLNEKRHLVSHHIRTKNDQGIEDLHLTSDDITTIQASYEEPFTQKVKNLLRAYANQTQNYSAIVKIENPAFIARACAKNFADYTVLLDALMERGFVSGKRQALLNSHANYTDIRIAAKGWEFLETLQHPSNSRQVFVAMSFDEELDCIYTDALKPAIEAADSANPLRAFHVGKHEHVGMIDDLIIAEIQRSRFVVADFTQHKGGVYFEAGYALGRNIPVIWCCKASDEKLLHFDIRQYNTIIWKSKEQLKDRLTNRIRALLGQENR